MANNSPLTHQLITIRDWIRYTASAYRRYQIKSHVGFVDHLSDAKSLVCFAVDLDVNMLSSDTQADTYLDARLTIDERKRVAELINHKLQTKQPTAYLTHESFFAGLSFYVDKRVLVPRSPIAELIEVRFSPWVDYSSVHRILDLCTGSACIAIACAYAFEGIQVDAVDISTDAIEVAKINQANHGLADCLNLHTGDLFAPLTWQKYDIIVSNPPYVDAKDMANLPDEIKHEPALGLEAGTDGLNVVHRILAKTNAHLNDNGILVVEVGNAAPRLIEAYPDIEFTWVDFQFGGDGVFLLTKKQLESFA